MVCMILLLPFLSSCATKRVAEKHPDDPFESVNRPIFAFNRFVDTIAVKPLAIGYRMILPSVVRTGVTNFFANIDDITIAANKVLQLEIEDAIQVSVRFLMNSTAGVGGIFDIASKAGLEKQRADFGLTLARWGVREAPFIMIPLLGPSTMRDGIGLAVDFFLLSPYPYIPDDIGYAIFVIDLLNIRANLLEDEYYFHYAAQDPYTFLRDLYLQRRKAQIQHMLHPEEGTEAGNWDDESLDDWRPNDPKPIIKTQ